MDLITLHLDNALAEGFNTIDPQIWNGLECIEDLHIKYSLGLYRIPKDAFITISDKLEVRFFSLSEL